MPTIAGVTPTASDVPCPVCSLDHPGPLDQWLEVDCATCGRNRFSARAIYECRRLTPGGRKNVSRGLAVVRRANHPVFDVRVEQVHLLRDWPGGGERLGS